MTAPQPAVRSRAQKATRTSVIAGDSDPYFGELICRLVELAERGLPEMFRQRENSYAFTRRGRRDGAGDWQTRLDGTSVRYGAICALGAQTLVDDRQRRLFGGETVPEFCSRLLAALTVDSELGEVALVSWLAGEIQHPESGRALELLTAKVASPGPAPIVETAWALTAAVALAKPASSRHLAATLAGRLLASRGGDGVLFPHNTQPASQAWYRQPVGCFADQVYPIQALARYHRRFDEPVSLAAAQACADRICQLQGSAGQWWWHYDWNQGDVIEGYPVYSVHQHAMAPMALLDLAECGGVLNDDAIRRGLDWLTSRPETTEPLIADELGLVWRKVARREPKPKVTRFLRGAARAISTRSRLSALDVLASPTVVDFECRPYELGWILYAWRHSFDSTATTGDSR